MISVRSCETKRFIHSFPLKQVVPQKLVTLSYIRQEKCVLPVFSLLSAVKIQNKELAYAINRSFIAAE